MHREARRFVDRAVDVRLVQLARDPVLGAEEAHEFHVLSLVQQVGRPLAPAAEARVVGDQADTLARQGPEPVALEDVDPGEHGGAGGLTRSLAALAPLGPGL